MSHSNGDVNINRGIPHASSGPQCSTRVPSPGLMEAGPLSPPHAAAPRGPPVQWATGTMAREGTPAETRLNLEHLEEQAEEVPLWSLSPHLQPPRRSPTEGRGVSGDGVELGQGGPSAEGAGGEARRLMENRDPKAVNSCLKVAFEDVIAEPASVRSFDRVWVWSYAVFEVSRVWCYRLISLLLAVPVSLVAGLLMALLSCLHIWLIMPCLQLCVINMRWVQVLWASVLNIVIGPLFTSMGKCCGSISIRMARD